MENLGKQREGKNKSTKKCSIVDFFLSLFYFNYYINRISCGP